MNTPVLLKRRLLVPTVDAYEGATVQSSTSARRPVPEGDSVNFCLSVGAGNIEIKKYMFVILTEIFIINILKNILTKYKNTNIL